MNFILFSVESATNALCDEELLAFNLAMQLGQDVRRQAWYSKVAALFVDEDEAGIPTMHDLTREALFTVVQRRFS